MFSKAIATFAVIVGLTAAASVSLPTAEAQAANGRNAAFIAGTVTGLTAGAILQQAHWTGYRHRHNYRPYYPRYRPQYRPAPRYRPYRPAPRYYGRPAPWTPAWYRYCHSKYRSFNPRTGYFTTYSGHKRFCR